MLFLIIFSASVFIMAALNAAVFQLRKLDTIFTSTFRYAMLAVALGAYFVFSLAWVFDSNWWLLPGALALTLFLLVVASRSPLAPDPVRVDQLLDPIVLAVNQGTFMVDRDTNLLVHQRDYTRCYVATLTDSAGRSVPLTSLVKAANEHVCETASTQLTTKVTA